MSKSTRSKTMTEKALAANRVNAKRSTGPRTPEGKARSRWNAVTHGILATAVIPPSLERYENPADFQALVASLHDELQPVGVVETLLVETVASCYWRLRRLNRAEGAAVSRAQEHAGTENEKRANFIATVHADRRAIEEALASGDLQVLQRVLDPEGIYPSCQGQGALAMAADQLRRIRDDLSEEEIKDPQTACDCASLADTHQALLFARYEAHLKRQIHRDLASLRSHQRDRMRRAQRNSDPAPALPPAGAIALPDDGVPAARQPSPDDDQTDLPPEEAPEPDSQAETAAGRAPSEPASPATAPRAPKSRPARRKSEKRTHSRGSHDRCRARPRLMPLLARPRKSRVAT